MPPSADSADAPTHPTPPVTSSWTISSSYWRAPGSETGVDLDKLVEVREIIARNLPDESLYGMYALAGAPKGFQPASRHA